MESSRQEYWSVLPFPPPGDLSHPGLKLTSLALARGFFTTALPGKPPLNHKKREILLFVTTQMDLEGIMLIEISQTEKNKCCMLSLTCGI